MEASAVLSAPDAQARKNAKAMTGWMKFIGIMDHHRAAASRRSPFSAWSSPGCRYGWAWFSPRPGPRPVNTPTRATSLRSKA